MVTLIAFGVAIVKFMLSVKDVVNEIALILVSLHHNVMVGELAKLKSFKNYLDCDESLIDDDSMEGIKEEDS
jgi:hypothetical protein